MKKIILFLLAHLIGSASYAQSCIDLFPGGLDSGLVSKQAKLYPLFTLPQGVSLVVDKNSDYLRPIGQILY